MIQACSLHFRIEKKKKIRIGVERHEEEKKSLLFVVYFLITIRGGIF